MKRYNGITIHGHALRRLPLVHMTRAEFDREIQREVLADKAMLEPRGITPDDVESLVYARIIENGGHAVSPSTIFTAFSNLWGGNGN